MSQATLSAAQDRLSRRYEQDLPDPAQLEAQVNSALERLDAMGVEAAVSVSCDTALTVSVRMGEVESVEFQRDNDLGITVYDGLRRATANSSDLSEKAIAAAVERAAAMAAVTSEDPCAGLPDKADLATVFPNLDLDHPWSPMIDELIDQARACESVALAADPRITNSDGASFDSRRSLAVMGNTRGFLAHQCATENSLSCSILAEQGDSMQRDYWYDVARDATHLADPVAIGEKAAERALARLGAKAPETMECPVVYSAEVARGLFGHFLGAINGGALYRQASFLLNSDGEQVFAPHIQISQNPLIPGALGSAAFDQEGVKTQQRNLINNGVLNGYLLSSYTARQLGLKTTGNAGGTFNLRVKANSLPFTKLLENVGDGVLVTELMGSGVNAMTGDYSRGAAGFRIRNGSLAEPLEAMTIAGNLKQMFQGIQGMGDDVDRRGNLHCGSIWVDRMTIAGQ